MAEDSAGRVQELERSMEALESQMREHVARTRAGATTVLVAGIIIVALIFIWVMVFTPQIKTAMEPANIVLVMESKADEGIAELIVSMEKTMKDNASGNVSEIRRAVMNQVPALRKKLEAVATAQIDKFATDLDKKADSIVDEILRLHKTELTPFVEAAVTKGNAPELEKELRKRLEETIGSKMNEVVTQFDRDMAIIEARLDRLLRPEKQLSEDEKFEKQCITKMLVYIDDMAQVHLQMPPATKP